MDAGRKNKSKVLCFSRKASFTCCDTGGLPIYQLHGVTSSLPPLALRRIAQGCSITRRHPTSTLLMIISTTFLWQRISVSHIPQVSSRQHLSPTIINSRAMIRGIPRSLIISHKVETQHLSPLLPLCPSFSAPPPISSADLIVASSRRMSIRGSGSLSWSG